MQLLGDGDVMRRCSLFELEKATDFLTSFFVDFCVEALVSLRTGVVRRELVGGLRKLVAFSSVFLFKQTASLMTVKPVPSLKKQK